MFNEDITVKILSAEAVTPPSVLVGGRLLRTLSTVKHVQKHIIIRAANKLHRAFVDSLIVLNGTVQVAFHIELHHKSIENMTI